MLMLTFRSLFIVTNLSFLSIKIFCLFKKKIKTGGWREKEKAREESWGPPRESRPSEEREWDREKERERENQDRDENDKDPEKERDRERERERDRERDGDREDRFRRPRFALELFVEFQLGFS